MTKQQGVVGLLGMCAVVLVLSVAGLASDFVTHLVGNIDGLLLLMICLMMGGLFSLMLFQMAREESWLPSLHKKQSAGSSAANPGPNKPGEGK
jgi:hypothetical protein